MFVFLDHALDTWKDMPRRNQEPVALSAHSLVIFERKVYAGFTIPVRALAQEAERARPMKRGSEPPYPLIHFPEERLVLDKSPLLLVHPHEPSGCDGRKRDLARQRSIMTRLVWTLSASSIRLPADTR